MHEMHVRKLNDSQLEEFNVEYVNEQRWGYIKACLDRDFGDGKFNFVDIGGGNGLFADKILHEYPNCTGTVLDYSELLLSEQ
ncbi:MAG: methyltransferase [Gammaproteobacteria bacterium]|nr:methyltransferase [Gammaproteobacteria bacterium]